MAKIIDLTGRGLKPHGMVARILDDPLIQEVKIVSVEKNIRFGSGFAVVVEIIRSPHEIKRFDLPWFEEKETDESG